MVFNELISKCKTKWLIVLLIGFFIQELSVSQGSSLSKTNFQFRDGVVLDTKRNEIYISNAEAFVEGLDLTSGEKKWTSKLSGRPLFIKNDILFVQVNKKRPSPELEIIGLNLNRQGAIESTILEKMPKGVMVRFMDSPEGSFHLIPRSIDSEIILEWIYRYPISGDYLSDEKPQVERGFLLFNGDSFDDIKSSDMPKNYNYNPIIPAKGSRVQNEKGQQFLSKDKTSILVSSFSSKPGIERNYNWRIYDRRTKKTKGMLKSNVSYAPFIVRKSIVIFEKPAYVLFEKEKTTNYPLQLVWYDFNRKKILNSVYILDDTYRGPTPP